MNYNGSIDMAAELIDGVVLLLASLALHGAMVCAAALLWWRRRRRQGIKIKRARFTLAGIGLGLGLALGAGLGFVLWRWSVLELEYFEGGLTLLELEAFFVFAASALFVAYWRRRKRSAFPLKKRWQVFGCIGLSLSTLALAFFRMVHTLWGFVPFQSWRHFKPTTLFCCGAALLLLAGGILLWALRKRGNAAWRRLGQGLLAAGLVTLTLFWPIPEIFSADVLLWGEYQFFEPAPNAPSTVHNQNSTHFYWLSGGYYEEYVLSRVPLEQPDCRPERIPLPAVPNDEYTQFNLAGLTDHELYIAITYADPQRPKYEAEWEKQDHNEAPLQIVVEEFVDEELAEEDTLDEMGEEGETYLWDAETEESTPAWWRTVVYRIPLDTLLGEKIYDGWYNDSAWYHPGTDSLLLIRELGGWTFAAQMNLQTGEKTLLWKDEWFFGSGNEFPFVWTPLMDGGLMLSKDPLGQEGNRVLFSADLQKTEESSWYLLRQNPPDRFFARQRLQRTPHLKDYAVWNGDVYYVAAEGESSWTKAWNGSYYSDPPKNLYRLNRNGKGKTLLWHDCGIDALKVVNGALFCRVNRSLPNFSFGENSSMQLTQWLRLNKEGWVIALVSQCDAALRPLGEDVLVWRGGQEDNGDVLYDGWDEEEQPLFSLYSPGAHDRAIAGKPWDGIFPEDGLVPLGGEKEPQDLPKQPTAAASWDSDWAITADWLYWLAYIGECDDGYDEEGSDERCDEGYVDLYRAPLSDLRAVEHVPLEPGQAYEFCGANQEEVLLTVNCSYDAWYYDEPSCLLRIAHGSKEAEQLFQINPEQWYWFNQASSTLLAASFHNDHILVESIDLNTQQRSTLFESSDYATERDDVRLQLSWSTSPEGAAALQIESYSVDYWNKKYADLTVLFDQNNRPALAAQYEAAPAPDDEEDGFYGIYNHQKLNGKTYYLANYSGEPRLYLAEGSSAHYSDELLCTLEGELQSLWLRRLGTHVAVVDGNDNYIALYDTAGETLLSQ